MRTVQYAWRVAHCMYILSHVFSLPLSLSLCVSLSLAIKPGKKKEKKKKSYTH